MELEKYPPLVNPRIEETADDIILYEHERTIDPVEIAFYLHHYVSREVRYDSRHGDGGSREFRDPLDALDLGGNCEEQCVLLASLLESKGIPYQFVELEHPGKEHGHLSLRCCVTERGEKALERIAELCESTETVQDYQKAISLLETGGRKRRWYFADPEMAVYLGDPSGYRGNGYMTQKGFEWLCHTRAFDPDRNKAFSE